MQFPSNEVLLMLIASVPGFVLGILGYIRSRSVDKGTEEATSASSQLAAVNIVVTGLNNIIDTLQEDNKSLRDELKLVAVTLKQQSKELLEALSERESIKREIQSLKRKYKIKN